ncbi:caspase family protein [Rhizobium brockwellii]|nr:caspase family protein [Rhizobium brockwellii]MDV4159217.1 caspase family protein [Rhizobium brockwellii]
MLFPSPKAVARGLACACAFYGWGLGFHPASSAADWSVKPSYESTVAESGTVFTIVDSEGQPRELYSASNAVLVMEGSYTNSHWPAVKQSASENETRLVEALEKRGFHVYVWRDLGSKELVNTVEDIRSNLGFVKDSRFFFYYFGHGKKLGQDGDDPPPSTFLVPVDAPPASDVQFEKVSFNINRLVELAGAIKVRHAFFALEACRAGEVILSMGEPAPNPQGYILSKEILRSSREFLTAGNADQDVPAKGEFSKLLVSGMTQADDEKTGDRFVTGSEMMTYVINKMPNLNPGQNPQAGDLVQKHGDFIFGRAETDAPELPVERETLSNNSTQIDLPPDVAASMSVILHVGNTQGIEGARKVRALLAKYGVPTKAIVPISTEQTPTANIIRYYNNGDLRGANALRDLLRIETGKAPSIEQPDGVRGQRGLVDYWL